jgi:hypothetical protein
MFALETTIDGCCIGKQCLFIVRHVEHKLCDKTNRGFVLNLAVRVVTATQSFNLETPEESCHLGDQREYRNIIITTDLKQQSPCVRTAFS